MSFLTALRTYSVVRPSGGGLFVTASHSNAAWMRPSRYSEKVNAYNEPAA